MICAGVTCTVQPRHACLEELRLAASEEIAAAMQQAMKLGRLPRVLSQLDVHKETITDGAESIRAAAMSTGTCLDVVYKVLSGQSKHGLCLTRPPRK